MSMTEETVRRALTAVSYPGMRRDIVALGLVREVRVRDDRVHVSLTLASPRPEVVDQLHDAIRQRLVAIGAVRVEVQVLMPEQATGTRAHPAADRSRIPNVRHVVAVGAGKGGVGKSTVAVNLALALQEMGLAVGLLDADIYGPSVPTLVGLEEGGRSIRMSDHRQILPLEAFGLAVVSFGFFLGAGSPVVWRGPMVGKAVKQFARGVVWPALDVLVVDLPPGTGDVPLALSEAVVVDGAIVVTTPQRLAVLEAGKAIEMFHKLGVPVLGLVENMSHVTCRCGRRSHPFGKGGGAELAARTATPLLAEVPFDEGAVGGGDAGRPILIDNPTGETAGVFRIVAGELHTALDAVAVPSPSRTTAAVP